MFQSLIQTGISQQLLDGTAVDFMHLYTVYRWILVTWSVYTFKEHTQANSGNWHVRKQERSAVHPFSSSPNMHAFGQWEELVVSEGNSCRHKKNVQIPHTEDPNRSGCFGVGVDV